MFSKYFITSYNNRIGNKNWYLIFSVFLIFFTIVLSKIFKTNASINLLTKQEFEEKFNDNLKNSNWNPDPQFSVFTQYDKEFYLAHKDEFLFKYKCFNAITKTIQPKRIIELGTHAGSGADAYISGSPKAEYIGYDLFSTEKLGNYTDQLWYPLDVANKLFEKKGFKHFKFIKTNLRKLKELPYKSEFVVVDAAHDLQNQYQDLLLALTANPTYIFVDDADGQETSQAIDKFLKDDVKDKLDYIFKINYIYGGLLIKLK